MVLIPSCKAAPELIREQALKDIHGARLKGLDSNGYQIADEDDLKDGQLALMAALYAIPYDCPGLDQSDHIGLDCLLSVGFEIDLPPEPDKRTRLVKAGALILAEIERLDRATARSGRTRT